MDSEGTAFIPLDEESVLRAIEEARALRAEAVAVSPAVVDRRIRRTSCSVGELLDEHWPDVPYTLSHRLNPIIREYRRASSTAIDASLKPLMQDYLATMERDLAQAGLPGAPARLDLVRRLLAAAGDRRPADLLGRLRAVDGARGGGRVRARGAARAGRADRLRHRRHDVRRRPRVAAGEINYTAETWLGGRWIGHITGIRSVDVKSIGAGGGSIAWIDPGGLLRVGPHSAGADPGPACYGRGGTQPDRDRRRRRARLDRPRLLPRRPAARSTSTRRATRSTRPSPGRSA